nr:MAG TPA: hypothetical protein [Caudoviricetes sp.]
MSELFLLCYEGHKMTTIKCKALQCLNNRKGKCMANFIVIDKYCRAFFTSSNASRYEGCVMKKEHNRYKSSKRSVLK